GSRKVNNGFIEHIAVSVASEDLFATGESDKHVAVWSFQSRRRVNELSTVLDFGGSRLGLACGSHPIVIAGSWTKGVVGYEVTNRKPVWSRPDLKYIQHVQDLSSDKSRVIGVALDEGPYHVLDPDNGEDRSKLANIVKIYASSFEPLYLLVGEDKTVHLSS